MEHLDRIRQYELLKIENILAEQDGKEPNTKRLQELTDYFISRNKPFVFDPTDERNILIEKDLQFGDICTSMEENGISKPKDLTVFEFYNKLRYFEKRIEQTKNQK